MRGLHEAGLEQLEAACGALHCDSLVAAEQQQSDTPAAELPTFSRRQR